LVQTKTSVEAKSYFQLQNPSSQLSDSKSQEMSPPNTEIFLLIDEIGRYTVRKELVLQKKLYRLINHVYYLMFHTKVDLKSLAMV
jgi:hypothetical protein